MKIFKTITVILCLVVLLGCASGSSLVTGTARPPTNPENVRIFLQAPPQYEIIGLVEDFSNVRLTTQAAQDRAINKLRERAANMGATGIILTNIGGTEVSGSGSGFGLGGGVGGQSGNFGFATGVAFGAGSGSGGERRIVQGIAIYVIEE